MYVRSQNAKGINMSKSEFKVTANVEGEHIKSQLCVSGDPHILATVLASALEENEGLAMIVMTAVNEYINKHGETDGTIN